MIILIAGASHTGKTVLSQKLLEKYMFPYFSIDHLKMGLIRSGQTNLTAESDNELIPYLWSIVKEIIKTAIENRQNLIVEGCYIPFNWKSYFDETYLQEIRYICLIMTKQYIEQHILDIKKHANDIEYRMENSYCLVEILKKDNQYNLNMCEKYKLPYILIEENYQVDLEL